MRSATTNGKFLKSTSASTKSTPTKSYLCTVSVKSTKFSNTKLWPACNSPPRQERFQNSSSQPGLYRYRHELAPQRRAHASPKRATLHNISNPAQRSPPPRISTRSQMPRVSDSTLPGEWNTASRYYSTVYPHTVSDGFCAMHIRKSPVTAGYEPSHVVLKRVCRRWQDTILVHWMEESSGPPCSLPEFRDENRTQEQLSEGPDSDPGRTG